MTTISGDGPTSDAHAQEACGVLQRIVEQCARCGHSELLDGWMTDLQRRLAVFRNQVGSTRLLGQADQIRLAFDAAAELVHLLVHPAGEGSRDSNSVSLQKLKLPLAGLVRQRPSFFSEQVQHSRPGLDNQTVSRTPVTLTRFPGRKSFGKGTLSSGHSDHRKEG